MNLVEQSGYSYSGISDIINDGKARDFLNCLESQYDVIKKEQAKLEQQLEKVKSERSHLVSCFIYAHKAIVGTDENLTFIHNNGSVVVVQIKEDGKINHEKHFLTIID